MEFCGMKREIDRKCLNHARVHANAQSFDRCDCLRSLLSEIRRWKTHGFNRFTGTVVRTTVC